jgi:cytosine deaminase
MVTINPASALGLSNYGIDVGRSADFVVFDAPTDVDAIRLGSRRHLVVRAGRIVARTEPAQTTVTWDGEEQPVTFLRD